MKDLILIKTEGKTDEYYLTTCPVFDEHRGKDLRDFKEDLKNAYEAVTLQRCKAWFISKIKSNSFSDALAEFKKRCQEVYGLDKQEGEWITDDVLYVKFDSDSFGNYLRLSSWEQSYNNYHIVIQLNKKDDSFNGLSFIGTSYTEAAKFLGLWVESCINN